MAAAISTTALIATTCSGIESLTRQLFLAVLGFGHQLCAVQLPAPRRRRITPVSQTRPFSLCSEHSSTHINGGSTFSATPGPNITDRK